jgi:hypothetical protein
VSVDQTQSIMDQYFHAMGSNEDFSRFYVNDVTWIMVDSGQVVRGPSVVRDFILELHSKMFEGQQRSVVV